MAPANRDAVFTVIKSKRRVFWFLTLIGTAIVVVLLYRGWLSYQTNYHPDAREMVRIRSFPAATGVHHRPLLHNFRDDVSTIALSQSGPKSLTDQQVEKVNPRLDGWDTEELSDRVSRQLKWLKKYVESIAAGQPQEVKGSPGGRFPVSTITAGKLASRVSGRTDYRTPQQRSSR